MVWQKLLLQISVKPGFLIQAFFLQLQGCLENSDYLARVEPRFFLPHLKYVRVQILYIFIVVTFNFADI